MQAAVGLRLRRGVGQGLTMDPAGEEEPPAARVGRLVRESPVVIFARRGCCMAHVMKRLLAAVDARASATVVELTDDEEEEVAAGGVGVLPALFVGGEPVVGGLEGLMALHLSGRLVPRLTDLGVLI